MAGAGSSPVVPHEGQAMSWNSGSNRSREARAARVAAPDVRRAATGPLPRRVATTCLRTCLQFAARRIRAQ